MKRRNFLKNSLGLAAFAGLTATNALVGKAMAHAGMGEEISADAEHDLEMVDETVESDFKYLGHRIRIVRRCYRRRAVGKYGSALSGARKERWAMSFNGNELPRQYFTRLESNNCFFSELLPFHNKRRARSLAKALVNGHKLKLFDLS